MASVTIDKVLPGNIVMHDHSESDLGAVLDSRYVSTSGDESVTGSLAVDNLKLDGNILSSTSGDVTLTPLAGQNLNVNLSTTGDLAVNTNQLYVDTSTGNVGIGTTTPIALLDVNGISRFTAATSGTAYTTFEAYGTAPITAWRRAAGTRAAPTQTLSGSTIFNLTGQCYTDIGTWLSAASVQAYTEGNITSTSAPGRLVFYTTAVNETSVRERMRIDSAGNVGIGTTAPTNLLSLGGNSARIFWMERHTTANTAGNTLTITAGGATSGATNKSGGNLLLQGGLSTGTGESGVTLYGCVAGATGTTDRTQTIGIQLLGNKVGVYGVTPIVRPTTAIAAATFVTNTSLIANDTATFDGYTIGQIVKALRNIGILT